VPKPPPSAITTRPQRWPVALRGGIAAKMTVSPTIGDEDIAAAMGCVKRAMLWSRFLFVVVVFAYQLGCGWEKG
jgi:hypothetical protein